jgi:hypothetical protein
MSNSSNKSGNFMKIFTTFTFTLLVCSLALNYALVSGLVGRNTEYAADRSGMPQDSLAASNARQGYIDPFEVVRSRMDEGLEQVRN